jgi:hypothetical protein
VDRRARWVALLGFSLAVYGPSDVLSEEVQHAVLSAQQLRARLSTAYPGISTLLVVYQSRPAPASAEASMGFYDHRAVAAKPPFCLFEQRAHGSFSLDWQLDPFQLRGYALEDCWRNYNPVNRAYFGGKLKPADPFPGTMPGELFLAATGLWPFERPSPSPKNGPPSYLREVANCRQFSDVRPRQEQVEGHWCHVLEFPGQECLWLNCENGVRLLARESFHRPTASLKQRWELGGHRCLGPDLYLPTRIRKIDFDYLAPRAEQRTAKLADVTYDVLDLRVNETVDQFFEEALPPGALLLDRAGPPVQTVPGGFDHLDNLVTWLRQTSPGVRSVASWRWGEIAAFVPLLILLCLEGHRLLRARGLFRRP